MSEPHIVVTGDPINGFEFIGPFASSVEAAAYGNNDGNLPDYGEWWIAPLEQPDEAATKVRALAL
jgi:hypothetical protein